MMMSLRKMIFHNREYHTREAENIRKIPRKRGLKIALEKEKQEAQSLSFDQNLAKEIEYNREVWLERVKIHLDKLLMKANRDNNILRHMAHHYQTQNKICNIKVKQMKDKLRKIWKGKKGGDKLKILFDASLAQLHI